jgi:phosphoribosylglycinamide formyltransferase-1
VDEIYDHGQIIFQATCPVLPDDTPVLLAKKIHQLEHIHFSRVIEELLSK